MVYLPPPRSSMVYLPSPRSSTASKATQSNAVSTSLKPVVTWRQIKQGVGMEKCKERAHFSTAESGLASTPHTSTNRTHLTWQSPTAAPHREGQSNYTKKTRSPVSELQHQRDQTVVSNEATPILKSSHPIGTRRQLGTGSTKYKWRRRSISQSKSHCLCHIY